MLSTPAPTDNGNDNEVNGSRPLLWPVAVPVPVPVPDPAPTPTPSPAMLFLTRPRRCFLYSHTSSCAIQRLHVVWTLGVRHFLYSTQRRRRWNSARGMPAKNQITQMTGGGVHITHRVACAFDNDFPMTCRAETSTHLGRPACQATDLATLCISCQPCALPTFDAIDPESSPLTPAYAGRAVRGRRTAKRVTRPPPPWDRRHR
jgi:hypothetical protein